MDRRLSSDGISTVFSRGVAAGFLARYSRLSPGRREMGTMKIRYTFPDLSEEDRELHQVVLAEELQLQAWYAIVCSSLLHQETVLPVQ